MVHTIAVERGMINRQCVGKGVQILLNSLCFIVRGIGAGGEPFR